MSPEEQVAHLTQYLPALGEIQDPKTAQAVAQVWFSALEMSPWVSFEQAKFKEDGSCLPDFPCKLFR